MTDFMICDCCGKGMKDCEKIMKNLDELQLLVDPIFSPFIDTLRALKDIKETCFKPILKPNWREALARFKNAWQDLYIHFDIWFSNKVHILIEHLPQVIERTGKSLYSSSEQVVEAAHAKFDTIWQRYKVTDLERDSHGDKLRNCVVDFNTKNI